MRTCGESVEALLLSQNHPSTGIFGAEDTSAARKAQSFNAQVRAKFQKRIESETWPKYNLPLSRFAISKKFGTWDRICCEQ